MLWKRFLVSVLIAVAAACTQPVRESPGFIEPLPPREQPAISWTFFPYDSSCGEQMLLGAIYGERNLITWRKLWPSSGVVVEGPETFRTYLAAVRGHETSIQIWRIEWAPAATGDTCFYPIAYPWLHHGMPAGILSIQISGVIAATDSTPGDQILFWRSHPMPDYINPAEDTGICMKAVYGEETE